MNFLDENEIKEKFMQFQMYEEQIKQLEKQLSAFDDHMGEIETIKTWLKEVSEVKPGTEMLVPISQGVFVKATLSDPSTTLVNIGGGASVEKTIEGTMTLLDGQGVEIMRARQETMKSLQKVTDLTTKLQDELAKKMKV